MGTVGLSFGSPTSGAGFDVSSTVAEIVGNLQNVETPWKTQLTSLESQDAAISNLGTLFSNLSNEMSSLTDFQGILAQKEGSSSDNNVLELTAATSSATAGTHGVAVNNLAQTSSGYLDEIAKSSDVLSGSIAIQVGSGTTENIVIGAAPSTPAANTIYTGSGVNTLARLAAAINGANLGVSANVLTDSTGSRLSLVSGVSGAAGKMNIKSSLADANQETGPNPTGALSYNSTVTGKDASLTIDGVPLTSASNTVTNLIPGVTFQLLAPSTQDSNGAPEPVQVVIANDNSGVESTVNQFITDYNSLISAVNTQEGNTSSGTPEPLFGSPTLSLLQQQLLSGLNTPSPNGFLDSISPDSATTLSGSITIQAGSGSMENIVIGAAPGSPAANTIYTGSGSGFNTLAGLAAAINSADSSTPVAYTASSDGTSGAIVASSSALLNGALTITTDTGSTQAIYLGPSDDAPAGDLATGTSVNTLSSLESFIGSNAAALGVSNVAVTSNGDGTSTLSFSSSDGNPLTVNSSLKIPGLGVTAAVSTSSGESTLTLTSQTAGANGALTVTSALSSNAPTPLHYSATTKYTSTKPDIGTLGAVSGAGDTLSGSLTIQVGSGTAQTITLDSSDNTLSGLMGAINGLSGVSAVLDQAGTGLTLTSGTNGATGALTVTSKIVDTTSPTVTPLDYNTSTDINSLTSLGISVNNDGSLTFDANSLDSLLNSDYRGVVGFFQSAGGWGQSFNNMLNNTGAGSSTGILGLAQSANSTTESTLNAEISREQSYISAQQTSLTAELNSANEIMQQLPTELNGMNELYSAITGYDRNMNG